MDAKQTSGGDWVNLSDQKKLIQISVPSQWLVSPDPQFELKLLGPAIAGKQLILTVQKIEVQAIDRMIIEASEQQTLAQLKQSSPDFHLLEQKVVTLEKVIQANIFRVSWTNSKGIRLVQSLMLVSGGKALFQVTATMPASEAGRLLPLMDRMFLSMRFSLLKTASASV